MRIRVKLIVAAVVLISGAVLETQSTCAQQIKRFPDGTIEVTDQGSGYDTQVKVNDARVSEKVQAVPVSYSRSPVLTRNVKNNLCLPAYTRRMGGVTVTRHADGTIDVVDNTMSFAPAAGNSLKSKSSCAGDVAIIRHADGRVDVRDTSMTSNQAAGKKNNAVQTKKFSG